MKCNKLLLLLVTLNIISCTTTEIAIEEIDLSQEFTCKTDVSSPNYYYINVKGFVNDVAKLEVVWVEREEKKIFNMKREMLIPKGVVDTTYVDEWYRDSVCLIYNPLKAKQGKLQIEVRID